MYISEKRIELYSASDHFLTFQWAKFGVQINEVQIIEDVLLVLIITYGSSEIPGVLPNKYDRDDHRNCWKTPLKVTNMGVGPANFTP